MAGIKLTTDLPPERALEVAWRAAQDAGFRLSPVQGDSFEAKKGHVLLSMIAGAFTPHCRFTVSAKRFGDATTDVVVDTNSPWLTSGMIGVKRVKGQAEGLADKIGEALQKAGGGVIERKEI